MKILLTNSFWLGILSYEQDSLTFGMYYQIMKNQRALFINIIPCIATSIIYFYIEPTLVGYNYHLSGICWVYDGKKTLLLNLYSLFIKSFHCISM